MNSILFIVLLLIVSSKCDFLFLEQKCTDITGDTQHFQRVVEAINRSRVCVNEVLDAGAQQTELLENRTLIERIKSLESVVKETCVNKEILLQCFINLSNAIRTCFTDDEIIQDEIDIQVTTRIVNYICSENGQIIEKFFNESGPECYVAKENLGLTDCVKNTFLKFTNPFSPILISINENNCGDLKLLKRCIRPIVSTCTKRTFGNIINGLINNILNQFSCDQNQ